MATTRKPWDVRGTDLATAGMHADLTTAHWLFFQYLRMSPSYALAHKEAVRGLPEEQKATLPSDFDEVRRMYALFGDVWHVMYRQWWLSRGLKAFGRVGNLPTVRQVHLLPAGEQPALHDAIRDYLVAREEEGMPSTLLVAIPTTRKPSDVMRELRKLVDRHHAEEERSEPRLKLMGERFRQKELVKGLTLLTKRAQHSKWALWRVGSLVGINKTVSKFLDPHKRERQVADPAEVVDRALVTKSTHRDLMKYETIAENAARGRFPCQDKVDKADFNYQTIWAWTLAWRKWEAKEKARLSALAEKQKLRSK